MWFRRKSFGADYDSVPKWHILKTKDGMDHTAACDYKYTFYYESPNVAEEVKDKTTCCRKCLATIPSPTASGGAPAVVRFPTEDEQRRGMLVVPRHKRLMKEEDNGAASA